MGTAEDASVARAVGEGSSGNEVRRGLGVASSLTSLGTAAASTVHRLSAYRVAPCGLGHRMCLQVRTRRLHARPGADRPRGQSARPQQQWSLRPHPAGRGTWICWPRQGNSILPLGLGTEPGAETTETQVAATTPELERMRPDTPDT